MRLTATEEQLALQDVVRKFLAAEYGFERRTRHVAAAGFDRGLWRMFGEMGWLGIGVAERWGGMGGPIEQAMLMEQFGRHLVVEPFVTGVVLAAKILELSDNALLCEEYAPRLVAGKDVFAVAWAEATGRYDPTAIGTRAEHTPAGFALSGRKIIVAGGGAADRFIVSAALDGGVGLFLIPAMAPGLSRRSYLAFDGSEAADIDLLDVVSDAHWVLAGPADGGRILKEAMDHASVALCAGLVGSMSAAVEMTADYSKLRTQFGKSLSDFQVVQHRLVDMLIAAEQSRAIVLGAIASLGAETAEREHMVSSSMVEVLDNARKVTGQAVHQHGGIGMTREYGVGHHYRRALIADKMFGDANYHLGRLVAQRRC
jgi:alkylation response protein AidB-like acyl-CoA dehydrogenase